MAGICNPSSVTEKVILISLPEKATAVGTRNNVRSSAISLSLQGTQMT